MYITSNCSIVWVETLPWIIQWWLLNGLCRCVLRKIVFILCPLTSAETNLPKLLLHKTSEKNTSIFAFFLNFYQQYDMAQLIYIIWDGTGKWNDSSRKAMTWLSYTIIIMPADGMVPCGYRASEDNDLVCPECSGVTPGSPFTNMV